MTNASTTAMSFVHVNVQASSTRRSRWPSTYRVGEVPSIVQANARAPGEEATTVEEHHHWQVCGVGGRKHTWKGDK